MFKNVDWSYYKSKKLAAFFITSFLMPSLNQMGFPDFVVQGVGQMGLAAIAGQSLVDVAKQIVVVMMERKASAPAPGN